MSAVAEHPSDIHARRETRLAELHALRKSDGSLSLRVVRQFAAAEAVTSRTVYRWLNEGLPTPTRATLPDELILLLAQCRGNVAKTYRRALAELSYPYTDRHLARQFNAALSPADMAMLREGERGYRKYLMFLRWEAEFRNQLWEMDSWEVPVWVRLKRGKRVFKPWVVVIIDTYSRAILAAVLVAKRPTQADVLVALHTAISSRSNQPFHGKPNMVRWDNGMEFLGNIITELAQNVGFMARSVRAWEPHLKGKVERCLRTLEQLWASELPGYLRGPRAVNGVRFDAGGAALTLDQCQELLSAKVSFYNLERWHGGLGQMAPVEKWRSDPTPIQHVDDAALRWMLPRKPGKITNHGVRYMNRWYFLSEVQDFVGRDVELAYSPVDGSCIDIYLDGKCKGTAIDQELMTEHDRHKALGKRSHAHKYIQGIVEEANLKIREDHALVDVSDPQPAAADAEVDRTAQLYEQIDKGLRSAARTNLLGITADVTPIGEAE